MADRRTRVLMKVLELTRKPEGERPEEEIRALVPWLSKIAAPFHSIEAEKVMLLLQFCNHVEVSRDEVIIRQGEIGDCFYVMLSGKASLYIDLNALDDPERVSSTEDTWEDVWERSGKRCLRLDRTKFGNFITSYEAGKGFGEMALIDQRSLRTGSIIADDNCYLLIIDRQLFNATLKERHELEREKRRLFIEESPVFSSWPAKSKRLLDLSLVQRLFPFDSCIARQGTSLSGLHFIIRGEAVVSVDNRLHQSQYPKILDAKARILAELTANLNTKTEKEKENADNRKTEQDPKNRVSGKSITICAIDQSEIIGALEFVLGLDTYAQTIISTTDLEVLVLDTRGIDRLFGRNKQSPAAVYLEDKVKDRLHARLSFSAGSKVQLYRHLLTILTDRKRKRDEQSRKSLSSRDSHIRLISYPPPDPNPRDDSTTQAGPGKGKGPENHRPPTGRRSTLPNDQDSNPSPTSTLATYYTSHILTRTKKFSRAYLRSREGGYGRQYETLSLGGRKLVVDRATRLLPRSRRELEHVALGMKQPKPRPNRSQNLTIQRYLSPVPLSADPEQLELARGLVQGSACSGGTSSPWHGGGGSPFLGKPEVRRSRARSRDSDDDSKDVVLGLEETLGDDRLREIALKIGNYHEDISDLRRQSIISCVFDSRRTADKRLQGTTLKLSRPRMTPASTKVDFDREASDENLEKVEEKLRRFYSELGIEPESDTPIVQKLNRFQITNVEEVPIPAGTVFVCWRYRGGDHGNRCDSIHGDESDSEKTRQKTRRYIIPKTAYPLLTSVLSNQKVESKEMVEADRNSRNQALIGRLIG